MLSPLNYVPRPPCLRPPDVPVRPAPLRRVPNRWRPSVQGRILPPSSRFPRDRILPLVSLDLGVFSSRRPLRRRIPGRGLDTPVVLFQVLTHTPVSPDPDCVPPKSVFPNLSFSVKFETTWFNRPKKWRPEQSRNCPLSKHLEFLSLSYLSRRCRKRTSCKTFSSLKNFLRLDRLCQRSVPSSGSLNQFTELVL